MLVLFFKSLINVFVYLYVSSLCIHICILVLSIFKCASLCNSLYFSLYLSFYVCVSLYVCISLSITSVSLYNESLSASLCLCLYISSSVSLFPLLVYLGGWMLECLIEWIFVPQYNNLELFGKIPWFYS